MTSDAAFASKWQRSPSSTYSAAPTCAKSVWTGTLANTPEPGSFHIVVLSADSHLQTIRGLIVTWQP